MSALLTTPKGVASYPRLNSPDTRFNADGVYKTGLIVPKEDAEKFLQAVQAEFDRHYENTCRKEGKKKLKAAELPWKDEEDDDGNATGNVVISFKMPAVIRSKKTNKVWRPKPQIMDSKLNVLKNPPVIWGGSTLRIGAEVYTWYSALGVGVTLRPRDVQIIKLVTGATAAFEEEDDGYEADEDEIKSAPGADRRSSVDDDDDEEGEQDEAYEETDPTKF